MSVEAKQLGQLVGREGVWDLPDGKHVAYKALTLSDWDTVERQAAKFYRRELIETYTDNLELLPESIREKTILEAFQRAEAITPDTLPGFKILMWLTQTRSGDLFALYLGMKRANPTVTLDQADELWSQHMDQVRLSAKELIEVSKATLGNVEAQPGKPTP